MKSDLSRKVAVVTGAGSGIGRASALEFARTGAAVVVSDIDEAGGRETCEIIKNAAGRSLFFPADVRDAEQVASLIATTVSYFGRIDFAHNNAGIVAAGLAATENYPEAEWHKMLSVNLTGVWLCMKYELKEMIKQGQGGAIVNTSSIAGLRSIAGASAYTAAKFGVIGLTQATALEYAQHNIRVNAICPGYVRTPMIEKVMDANKEKRREDQIEHIIPMGGMSEPADIAESVVWLCSDSAKFVTGHALPIDGGLVAQGFGPR